MPLEVHECNVNEWDSLHVALIHDDNPFSVDKVKWREEYAKDTNLLTITSFIHQGWPEKSKVTSSFKPFWEVRNELTVIDGTVFHGDKAVPPTLFRNSVLKLCHEDHCGIVMTKQRVKKWYWWPGIDINAERIVRECVICANSDKSLKTPRPDMCEPIIPDGPWQTVAIDIMGPIGTIPKYIVSMIDIFSRWPSIGILDKIDSVSVLQFIDRVFIEEGFPVQIISDSGVQFLSKLAQSYFERVGVKHKTTSLYNPSGNGICERFNRVLKNAIQIAVMKESVGEQSRKA